MKIYTRIVVDMASGAWLEADAREYAGPLALAKGGSSSASTTSTENVDRRQVVDNQSVGVSSDSSTVYVTPTDLGSVRAAFEFAGKNSEDAQNNVNTILGIADRVFVSAFKTLDKTQEVTRESARGVAVAYEGARGAGNEKTMLTIAALAVVGLVAVKVWGK